NLYIADSNNNRIRKVSNGVITTVAGNGTFGFRGDNGPATSAELSRPTGVAVDSAGDLYIADASNERIREVSNGLINTVAGNGTDGLSGDNGPATSAEFDVPSAVAVNSAGSIYIADQLNNRIRLLSPSFSSSAITSVSTASGGANIAQNTFIVIKGVNLVPETTPAVGVIWSNAPSFASGQMPTQLGGVSVTINGKPAYIYFFCSAATSQVCTSDQINVLTPLDSTTGLVPIVVASTTSSGTTESSPYEANLAAVAPTLLAFGSTSYVAATHANSGLVGPTSLYPGSSTPAQPGEQVAVYSVGFGLPTTPLASGSSTQSGVLPSLPVCVVGTNVATVTYSGLISPGLYQLNIVIPDGTPNGDQSIGCRYDGTVTPGGILITVSQ
ncbi:MAG TPA: hypothetical protein VME43_12090, partial [Bryobacteraceae bacterium]|nr:hypothetical protein [Bryobacteraceae bacterium]